MTMPTAGESAPTVEDSEPTIEIAAHTVGNPAPACRWCENDGIYCDAGRVV